mmetsp:Transcript_13369/g.55989  ORF Transcript_13369/g.55989 Transcript_13369/m.55989 type:complete len:464 (-) Transcript_13369:292-1683(-)
MPPSRSTTTPPARSPHTPSPESAFASMSTAPLASPVPSPSSLSPPSSSLPSMLPSLSPSSSSSCATPAALTMLSSTDTMGLESPASAPFASASAPTRESSQQFISMLASAGQPPAFSIAPPSTTAALSPMSFSESTRRSSVARLSTTRRARGMAEVSVRSFELRSSSRSGQPECASAAQMASIPRSHAPRSPSLAYSSLGCTAMQCASAMAPCSPKTLSARSRRRRLLVAPAIAAAIAAPPAAPTRVLEHRKSSIERHFASSRERWPAPSSPVMLLKKCSRRSVAALSSGRISAIAAAASLEMPLFWNLSERSDRCASNAARAARTPFSPNALSDRSSSSSCTLASPLHMAVMAASASSSGRPAMVSLRSADTSRSPAAARRSAATPAASTPNDLPESLTCVTRLPAADRRSRSSPARSASRNSLAPPEMSSTVASASASPSASEAAPPSFAACHASVPAARA